MLEDFPGPPIWQLVNSVNIWGQFLKGGINSTRYNSYSRDKPAILGITISGIKMGSRKHYLFLE